MAKRMLIDATHPEETRVVVMDGTRLEEFDVETSTKKQIKGNIYLAKVVRVEPSLQAAFVDYGGNRHGFLAFSEIHPDYYQIPVADRERLMAEVARHEEEEHDDRERADSNGSADAPAAETHESEPGPLAVSETGAEASAAADETGSSASEDASGDDTIPLAYIPPAISAPPPSDDNEDEAEDAAAEQVATAQSDHDQIAATADPSPAEPSGETGSDVNGAAEEGAVDGEGARPPEGKGVETIGGEDPEEDDEGKQRRRFVASRHYKIQEVIKRRQIMLVQVVKEERGNKGAALTTYLSLAGRYCVLMPNSARGGGVSRKITSAQDRRRLKQIVGDLELPRNMAVILRTAGAERSKAEIKRDYEYLQRTWNNIREITMQSRAPALIHEEASLIKRSIRDIYSRDIEEVWVEGDEGYKVAKDFMRMLTPSHAKKVQRYKDDLIPLFHRYQVESQMETINSPVVQLRSGGSIVFGQTEALVAIDVNSGRATRERHIEETAFKTNMEAAEEIARQLRLRDLAGLVVIDFIDMEDHRNNHAVERRLKEALKADRARIQVGRISHFGLLELSRQRLRPSLIETNFKVCSHCAGTGLVRSTESAAVHTLRMIEEEGVRRRSSELTVTVHPEVALYLLNYKREMLASVEARYSLKIFVLGDDGLIPPNLRIDRVKALRVSDDHAEALPAPPRELAPPRVEIEEDEDSDIEEEDEDDAPPQRQREDGNRPREHQGRGDREDGEGGRRRRRRRRRRRGGEFRDGPGEHGGAPAPMQHAADAEGEPADTGEGEFDGAGEREDGQTETHRHADGENGEGRRGRRRGRRGGRRRRRGGDGAGPNGEHSAHTGGDFDHGDADTGGAGAEYFPEDQPPAPQNRFPEDHTHAAAPDVHPDETANAMRSEPATAEDAAGNGERRGFFSALKAGAFGWRRTEQQQDSGPAPMPEPAPRVEPEPAPAAQAAPPPQEEIPSGPPRRGWWQQGR